MKDNGFSGGAIFFADTTFISDPYIFSSFYLLKDESEFKGTVSRKRWRDECMGHWSRP
jgi:hypothetical protein